MTNGQLIDLLEMVVRNLRAGVYDVKGALEALSEALKDIKLE